MIASIESMKLNKLTSVIIGCGKDKIVTMATVAATYVVRFFLLNLTFSLLFIDITLSAFSRGNKG